MSRVRNLFITVLPPALAGGLLLASAFGHAETGDHARRAWPAMSDVAAGAVLVAQADPPPARYRGLPVPPPPPPPGAPPAPIPPPPGHDHRHRRDHGVSVSIHDGKIEIDGVAELVEHQLEKVASLVDDLPDMPPDARERVRTRIRTVRDKINARLGKLRSMDFDRLERLGPEMERMGDEIEKEMEGLDKDLSQLGDKLGERFAHKFGRDWARRFSAIHGRDRADGDDSGDDDDEDDEGEGEGEGAVALPPGADNDLATPSDLGPAMAALRGVALDPDQRQQLARLRADADRQVASAQRELDEMSSRLHDALRDAAASEADIARQIDSISAKEAVIRKARILAWVKARNVLRPEQRERVEAAARRGR